MLKVLLVLIGLCALPVVTMLLLKFADKRVTFGAGYVSGVIVNLTLFSLCVCRMAENMANPGLAPVKAVLGMICGEMVIILILAVVRCIKMKSRTGLRSLFLQEEGFRQPFRGKEAVGIAAAGALWLSGAFSYLHYVPDGAVTMMADINRLDFFGMTNPDIMVMLGYYLKKLFGISQADAVCIVIPLSLYAAFVVLMWETAGALFEGGRSKRVLCFLAEAVLTIAGDCMYTQSSLVLHGLNHMENAMLALCVPFAFAIGLRFYHSEGKTGKERLMMPGYWISFAVCIISACLLEQRAFALVGLNAIIFGLLFIGRRYLPWLQSSKL